MTSRALCEETRRQLLGISTATITTQLLRRGLRTTFIPSLIATRPDLRLVGVARTLRYVPSREDLGIAIEYDNARDPQRIAVESMKPGEVLVIDARGEIARAASFGQIIATRIRERGAAGLVTDGALRDFPTFQELDLPAYARGAHAATSSIAHRAVDFNVAIGCGGVLVLPGDIVVGDAEGVVVIPAQLARDVASDGHRQQLVEQFALERVRAGDAITGIYPLAEEQEPGFKAWLLERGEASQQSTTEFAPSEEES